MNEDAKLTQNGLPARQLGPIICVASLLLAFTVVACSGAPATGSQSVPSTSTSVVASLAPTASPSPTPSPTPSPSPTVDPSVAAAGYLAIAEALHQASCVTNAAMDKDPDSLPVLKEAFADVAKAAEIARQDLSELRVPALAEPLRLKLVGEFGQMHDAAVAVSGSSSFKEVDKVFPAFEKAVAALGVTAKALRAALGLPPSSTDC